MSDIVPGSFAFDGEEFPVVRMTNGDIGLPLRRLTLPVGLDPDGQRKLIERAAWSEGRTDNMYVRLPGDDRRRKHFVISYRIIPMWIANIESGRMKDEIARARIGRWQVEFADALYDYVFDGGATNPRAVAAASMAALPAPEPAEPDTYPLVDVIVLMKQRFGVRVHLNNLTRILRAGGVLRQDGRPHAAYSQFFWLKKNGTYEVFEHAIAPLYHVYEATKLRLEMAAQAALRMDPPGWPELPLT